MMNKPVLIEETDRNEIGPPSGPVKFLLSAIILAYLAIVVLGPMSNPVGSEDLTVPLAKSIAPVHQALFLGHGYRFFGPDPGPSHILEYKIEDDDGDAIEGRFPDRDQHWPRLLYHRWFMLSESIYEDRFQLIEGKEFTELVKQLDAEIESVRLKGELANARSLKRDRDRLAEDNSARQSRTDYLLKMLGHHLLTRRGGDRIELFLRERLIAGPDDVASRVRLNHPRFLSEPKAIGKFSSKDTAELESIE